MTWTLISHQEIGMTNHLTCHFQLKEGLMMILRMRTKRSSIKARSNKLQQILAMQQLFWCLL
ncbi:hypothetical protein PVAP13_2KG411706 [Panicum virgatum]|uniref:Uncharacterized protein n=1 Tax=Panicum virgatum TaxID=38727 RepID=A0A8T0W9I3_PANVG|nr:hypothetical protein PVAP13_2KG411706 [Panicum virgatum]